MEIFILRVYSHETDLITKHFRRFISVYINSLSGFIELLSPFNDLFSFSISMLSKLMNSLINKYF